MGGAGNLTRSLVPAVFAALALAGSARAQPAPGQTFDGLVKMLDAPELSVRESAAAALSQGDRYSLSAIEKALIDPNLSAEQRQRLRWAGRQLFGRSPRAALGVRFSDMDGAGMTVDPVPKFDSERVLRPGDTLASIDGIRIVNQIALRQLIVSHDPGDEVTLGVVRSGTPMTVTVKMGRMADLDQRPPSEAAILGGAWAYRLQRLGEARSAPVESPLTSDQWRDIVERIADGQTPRQQQMHDPFTGEPVRSAMNRPPVAALSIGGQARYSAEEPNMVVAQRDGPIFFQRGGGRINAAERALLDQVERDNLRSQHEECRKDIEANNARINDPATPEADRTTLRILNDQNAMRMQAIEARIQLLGRVAEPRP